MIKKGSQLSTPATSEQGRLGRGGQLGRGVRADNLTVTFAVLMRKSSDTMCIQSGEIHTF